MIEEGNVTDVIDDQLERQGVSAIRTSDGTVFTFTPETLRRLLAHAEVAGKVIVFVKHGVRA